MKKLLLLLILPASVTFSQLLDPHFKQFFMQGNNINTVFNNVGISNYDFYTFPTSDAGFIWPVTSNSRMTAIYTSGIWIAAKVGPGQEIRTAISAYASHFSPGNIPVIGGVPPSSVCNDSLWRGFLVQLTDPALVNGGVRVKIAGGRQYTFNYSPWASWPVEKGAPYVEINGIPGYQPAWDGDRPGIGNGSLARPDELSFMVFMDYTRCTNAIHTAQVSLPGGTLPMGVEVHQLNFMFNCPPLQNMYFVKWRLINKSSLFWDSAYTAIYSDNDIGNSSCGAGDDAYGCDTNRNLAYIYNADNNDCNYGSNPPACGSAFLQSPLKFTGNNSDTAKLPYDTLVGYKMLGMSSCINFIGSAPDPCDNDPDEYNGAYYFMKGKDGCGRNYINPITGAVTRFRYTGDACNRTGWFDSSSHDTRYLLSSGPFRMNSGDTQIITMSFMIARDGGNNYQNVCALLSSSDSALRYYYNDFRLCTIIGIQPISTEIPQRFELLQNYPNPFNPATKIQFQIPARNGHDRSLLRIYDALGREISTLVSEELDPGTYEVNWDASNYPSGVYFYILSSGKFIQTKKMLLIK